DGARGSQGGEVKGHAPCAGRLDPRRHRRDDTGRSGAPREPRVQQRRGGVVAAGGRAYDGKPRTAGVPRRVSPEAGEGAGSGRRERSWLDETYGCWRRWVLNHAAE